MVHMYVCSLSLHISPRISLAKFLQSVQSPNTKYIEEPYAFIIWLNGDHEKSVKRESFPVSMQ